MEFRISRASLWNDDVSPCEEAYQKVVEVRKDKKYVWQEEKAVLLREEEVEVKDWFVKVDSLEDLMKLSEKYGELIINWEEKSITIYDDYIE